MTSQIRLLTINARRAEEAATQAEAFANNNDPIGAEIEAKAAASEAIEASAEWARINAHYFTTIRNTKDQKAWDRAERELEKARALATQTRIAANRAEEAMTRAINAEVKRNNPPNP